MMPHGAGASTKLLLRVIARMSFLLPQALFVRCHTALRFFSARAVFNAARRV